MQQQEIKEFKILYLPVWQRIWHICSLWYQYLWTQESECIGRVFEEPANIPELEKRSLIVYSLVQIADWYFRSKT